MNGLKRDLKFVAWCVFTLLIANRLKSCNTVQRVRVVRRTRTIKALTIFGSVRCYDFVRLIGQR
jgi:hypothetical protein